MEHVVVGVFNNASNAQQARQQLITAGFSESDVMLRSGEEPYTLAVLVADPDIRRARLVECLEQVLLAGFAGLTLAAAGADCAGALLVEKEVRCAGSETVTRRTAADTVVHLLPGSRELLGRRVRTEGKLLRDLRLHLRDLVADQRIEE